VKTAIGVSMATPHKLKATLNLHQGILKFIFFGIVTPLCILIHVSIYLSERIQFLEHCTVKCHLLRVSAVFAIIR